MAGYHRYVFDVEGRRFVGDFEGMYRSETTEAFDSWHQEDSRQLNRQLALSFFGTTNFGTVLDLGCGKGSLTHHLKRRNNRVIGIDVSQTAIDVARARFPDIEFLVHDVGRRDAIASLVDTVLGQGNRFDLTVIAELLSYLERWKEMLNELAARSRFLIVTLYLPQDPIGFVKSRSDLVEAVQASWDCIEVVTMELGRFTVIFAQSKQGNGDPTCPDMR
jgi:SAM-dependent methyltransferase